MATLMELKKNAARVNRGEYPALRQKGRGVNGLRFSVKEGTLTKGLDATFVGTNGEEIKANATDFVWAPVSIAWENSARRSSVEEGTDTQTSSELAAAETALWVAKVNRDASDTSKPKG